MEAIEARVVEWGAWLTTLHAPSRWSVRRFVGQIKKASRDGAGEIVRLDFCCARTCEWSTVGLPTQRILPPILSPRKGPAILTAHSAIAILPEHLNNHTKIVTNQLDIMWGSEWAGWEGLNKKERKKREKEMFSELSERHN